MTRASQSARTSPLGWPRLPPTSTVPRVRSFPCGQALAEEVAFSLRQRTTGSRLHHPHFPFVHDDHHQGQSLLILFCLFLLFVVLGCFLSQPFRFRSAVSLRAEIQVALARESVKSSPIVRIFGKGKRKLIANFSATMVTSLPSLSLSLSLSVSLSLTERTSRTISFSISNSFWH